MKHVNQESHIRHGETSGIDFHHEAHFRFIQNPRSPVETVRFTHTFSIFHFYEKETHKKHRNRYPEIFLKGYILIPGPH